MRLRISPLLLFVSLVATAHAADEAAGYRVAFIRPGAEGSSHGGSLLARVGSDVLVGSPASDRSSADVYDARTGALRYHFPEPLGGYIGRGVAGARRSFLIGNPLGQEVYLFSRRDGRLRRTLRPPPDAGSRGFGTSMAEVGKTIVVGDPGGGAATGPFTSDGPGSVSIFDAQSGDFIRVVTSPAPVLWGRFGSAVVACAGGFAVGEGDSFFRSQAGAVHVYDQDGKWRQTLQAPTPAPGDGFGSALAAAGARLLIGSPGRPVPLAGPGEAFLYQRRHGRYVLIRTLTRPVGTLSFGRAVDLLGRRAVVGSSKAATLFDVRSGATLAILKAPVFLDPDMTMAYEPYLPWGGLGFSVAIVGKTIVVGSEGSQEDAGSLVVGFAPKAPLPPECGGRPYPCPYDPVPVP